MLVAPAKMSIKIEKKQMLALFELPPNFSLDQLKGAYKRLVLKYHPDKTKCISDTPMFQMLTSCYKTLSEDLNTRLSQREFNELKASFRAQPTQPTQPAASHSPKQQTSQKQPQTPTRAPSQNKRFDTKVFNKLFDDNKMKDPAGYDDGYGDWINNPKSFNERSKHSVVVYKEPQAFMSSADDLGFYEFGINKVKDHTAQNLQYMDYRLAHTTDKIIDTSKVKPRKEYRNIEELEVDRANVSHTMTEAELHEYAKRQKSKELKELERQNRQKLYDSLTMDHFNRINNTLSFDSLR